MLKKRRGANTKGGRGTIIYVFFSIDTISSCHSEFNTLRNALIPKDRHLNRHLKTHNTTSVPPAYRSYASPSIRFIHAVWHANVNLHLHFINLQLLFSLLTLINRLSINTAIYASGFMSDVLYSYCTYRIIADSITIHTALCLHRVVFKNIVNVEYRPLSAE